jgi:hypothetical protein
MTIARGNRTVWPQRSDQDGAKRKGPLMMMCPFLNIESHDFLATRLV